MVAMFATMLKRDRERNGLRVARASWLVGVTVREYREIEAGTKPPSYDTYEHDCEPFGWPQSFTSEVLPRGKVQLSRDPTGLRASPETPRQGEHPD